MIDLPDLLNCVDDSMQRRYRKRLADMRITDTPGYWEDLEPVQCHCGHLCRSTYTYYDSARDASGRWASQTRTWKAIFEATR